MLVMLHAETVGLLMLVIDALFEESWAPNIYKCRKCRPLKHGSTYGIPKKGVICLSTHSKFSAFPNTTLKILSQNSHFLKVQCLLLKISWFENVPQIVSIHLLFPMKQ